MAIQLIPVQQIGTAPIVIKTTLTPDEIQNVITNHGHVFVLHNFKWQAETGEATVEFVPGNGLCIIQDVANEATRTG